MKFVVLFLLAAFSSFASDKIQILKDGSEWTATVSGTVSGMPASGTVLRILAAGDLTVRGKRSKDIRYTITRKLPVTDEATARLIANAMRVRRLTDELVFDEPG